VIAEWNERGIEALERRWHEDIVWEEAEGFPDAGAQRGRDAVFARARS
jgi:hypothetical protein